MGRSLGILAIGLVAAFTLFLFSSGESQGGVDCPTIVGASNPCFLVNSTTDQGDFTAADLVCETTPVPGSLCSLRAAIEQANSLGSGTCNPCTIKFDPTIFPNTKNPPPSTKRLTTVVIGEATGDPLPPIEVPLTIDARDVRVILEPEAALPIDWGLFVLDDRSGDTDFTLWGNKTDNKEGGFSLRGFTDVEPEDCSFDFKELCAEAKGDGIFICGDGDDAVGTQTPTPAGSPTPTAPAPTATPGPALTKPFVDCGDDPIDDVLIDGVSIKGKEGNGIKIDANNIDRVTISNNNIFTVGGDGVELEGGDGDVIATLTGNDIYAGDDALHVDDAQKCRLDIFENPALTGLDHGLYMECEDGSVINIDDNGPITGKTQEAIHVSDSGSGGGNMESITLNIRRNGKGDDSGDHHPKLKGIFGGDEAVRAEVCDGSTVNVIENGQIVGVDNEGIEVNDSGCESDTSDNITVSVIDNQGGITAGDQGIEIDAQNNLDVEILRNGDFKADNDCISIGTGTDDDLELDVIENGNFQCGERGIEFDTGDGADVLIEGNGDFKTKDDVIECDCQDGADIDIIGNGNFNSRDDDGVDINAGPDRLDLFVARNGDFKVDDRCLVVSGNNPNGTKIVFEENGDCNAGNEAIRVDVGKDNVVWIVLNGDLESGDDDAIEIDADNSIEIGINKNGNIFGEDNGIDIDVGDRIILVDIIENGNIRGLDHGILIRHDVHKGSIIDNGVITGASDEGIHIIGDDNGDKSQSPAPNVNNMTISGNWLIGSEDEGIELECKGRQENCEGSDNVISNNLILQNGQEGVLIEGDDGTSFTRNTIGGGSPEDGNYIEFNAGPGVRIENSNDNLIKYNMLNNNGIEGTGVVIEERDGDGGGVGWGMADGNTISRNSMHSNTGLGIDLDKDGLGTCSDGTSVPVGPDGTAALDPNQCLAAPPGPVITGGKAVGVIPGCGINDCLVELFATDNPPDPTGFGEGQHFIGDALTDALGSYSIQLDEPCGLKPGSLTATVTDLAGNTSEFSLNTLGFEGTDPCGPPTATPVPPTDTPGPTTPATPTNTAEPATDTPVPPPATDTPVPPPATDTQVPPPTDTAVPPPTDTPVVVDNCGDVNNDGEVDSEDALLILQAKVGFIDDVPKPSAADVNGDGEMTSEDALIILQVAAGFIDRSDLNCP